MLYVYRYRYSYISRYKRLFSSDLKLEFAVSSSFDDICCSFFFGVWHKAAPNRKKLNLETVGCIIYHIYKSVHNVEYIRRYMSRGRGVHIDHHAIYIYILRQIAQDGAIAHYYTYIHT